MCATYYARTSDHGYETCAEHLAMAGCLAGGFAKGFGYLDDGLLAGLVHDLGKYSDAFQRRIRNPDHCGPVDHSTAGALLLMRHACPLAAMAVAGHHAGLPDLGSYGELEGPTFMSRMNRARRAGDCNLLALAQAGEAQLDIPQSAFLHGTRSAKPMTIRTQSKTAKVSPQMAGAVMKAILEDTPYPMTLINAVERRINAEHDISPDKAAIIKAYYLRATTNAQFKEVLRMDINEESGYLPYVLGRMFSIYEQIQLAAIPGINTTIKDKYFTSASTTPARIFPILGDLAAKHMRKTWKSEGLKVKLDKALGELTGRVGDRYPSRLSLEERGAFQLGYYFENQKRFDKANKKNNEQGENND